MTRGGCPDARPELEPGLGDLLAAVDAGAVGPGLHAGERLERLAAAQLGSLDHPEVITPKLEMFVKRRLAWVKPLGLPEFSDMPH